MSQRDTSTPLFINRTLNSSRKVGFY